MKNKWLLPFCLAAFSGFTAAVCAANAMGKQNSPYMPYAVFFVALSCALVVISIATAEKGNKQ